MVVVNLSQMHPNWNKQKFVSDETRQYTQLDYNIGYGLRAFSKTDL